MTSTKVPIRLVTADQSDRSAGLLSDDVRNLLILGIFSLVGLAVALAFAIAFPITIIIS
jgi:hypothetical protein